MSKPVQYYMRTVHRVLGFLTIGMVIVYALSGITLIHRTGDFMKHAVTVEVSLAPGLTADQLGVELKMKNFTALDENDQVITFANGTYEKASGRVSYVKKELVSPFDKMVELHKLPDDNIARMVPL